MVVVVVDISTFKARHSSHVLFAWLNQIHDAHRLRFLHCLLTLTSQLHTTVNTHTTRTNV